MPWQELGGANTGLPNNGINPMIHWLGTRNNAPLIIRTENGPLGAGNAPNPAAEVMRITPADPAVLPPGTQPRSVGIGTGMPRRRLHVEPSEIHSGGSGAGFSFGNRLDPSTGQPSPFTEKPTNGQRWVWYASGGRARLWSGTDKIEVTIVGGIRTQGTVNSRGDVTALGSVTAEEAVTGDRANFLNDVRGGHGEFNSTRVGVTGVSASSSTTVGVRGESTSGSSELGIGVHGTNLSGFAGVDGVSDSAFGVRGISISNVGVVGHSTTDDGVRGISTSGGDGLSGISTGGNGVFGQADENSGRGGVFDGGITVVRGPKSFKIDHPLDPENRYLVHTSVESSEMKNVYDGVAQLDEDGVAWVGLPEWFEALNGDFRYQLTAVGGSAPNLHVAEEASENRFKIAGGQEGMKVCWQLTGSRKDPWAAANPFEVEQEKPEEDRGRYLVPSLYDAPEEQRVMVGPSAESLRVASTLWTGEEPVEEERRPPQPPEST